MCLFSSHAHLNNHESSFVSRLDKNNYKIILYSTIQDKSKKIIRNHKKSM